MLSSFKTAPSLFIDICYFIWLQLSPDGNQPTIKRENDQNEFFSEFSYLGTLKCAFESKQCNVYVHVHAPDVPNVHVIQNYNYPQDHLVKSCCYGYSVHVPVPGLLAAVSPVC